MSATLAMLARNSASHGAAVLMVMVVLLGIIGIWMWGLIDALLVPDDSLYRSGSKVIWVCLIIFLGVIGAIIYAAAGAPSRADRLRYAGKPTPLSGVPSQNEHEVFSINDFYTCAADDCDFETSSITEAKRHQRSGGRVAPVHVVLQDPDTSTYWCRGCDFQSQDILDADIHSGRVHDAASESISPKVAPSAAPEFKTCPDCAEEVRFAARKCRFCGYMFEPADVPR